jgi:hypothetical protein
MKLLDEYVITRNTNALIETPVKIRKLGREPRINLVVRNHANPVEKIKYAGRSSLAPAPTKKLITDKSKNDILLPGVFAVKSPRTEEKKATIDTKPGPEGLLPAITKIPSGTRVATKLTMGIRLN